MMIKVQTLAKYILDKPMTLERLHVFCCIAQGEWLGQFKEKLYDGSIYVGSNHRIVCEGLGSLVPQSSRMEDVITSAMIQGKIPQQDMLISDKVEEFVMDFLLPMYGDRDTEDLQLSLMQMMPFAATRFGMDDDDPTLVPVDYELLKIHFSIVSLDYIREVQEQDGSHLDGLYAFPACITLNADGRYEATFPQLPDIHAYGASIANTMKDAHEKLSDAYMDGKFKTANEIPETDMPLPECGPSSTAVYILVDFMVLHREMLMGLEIDRFRNIVEARINEDEAVGGRRAGGASHTLN